MVEWGIGEVRPGLGDRNRSNLLLKKACVERARSEEGSKEEKIRC